MIISCQAVAVLAAGIALNRAFLFYDSWGELLGHQGGGGQAAIAVTDEGQLVPADGSQGRISILTVHGKVSGATEQVLVWLPPQYDAAGEKRTRFPVIMALPGQPGTPAGIFKTLDLGSNAMQMIKSGQVKPFVAVIPPLSIAQPRDTECTDIPARSAGRLLAGYRRQRGGDQALPRYSRTLVDDRLEYWCLLRQQDAVTTPDLVCRGGQHWWLLQRRRGPFHRQSVQPQPGAPQPELSAVADQAHAELSRCIC